MNAALSTLTLAAILGLGLLYLLGLGWLVVGPLIHGSLAIRRGESALLLEIPLALTAGMMANYGLLLAFQHVRPALAAGVACSAVGLGMLSVSFLRDLRSGWLPSPGQLRWVGAAVLCLVLLVSPILAEALTAWDARSIWFFHAKMIYTAGSIGLAAGWQDPTVIFSHTDYPNLMGAMAAQLATLMRFWNEYLPKAALFFMLVPALLWLFSFARRSISFLMLVLLLPFALSTPDPPKSLYAWMWNGYMDGYLALFFAIAVLLLGRYRETSRAVDMASALCILLLLPNLKNEGIGAALAALPLVAWLVYARNRQGLADLVRGLPWKYYLAGLVGILPAVLWGIYKMQWGLASDMTRGTAGEAVARLTLRLQDGSLQLILQRFWESSHGAFLLLGVLCTAYVAWTRPVPGAAVPPLFAAGIYGGVIIMIYLLTPHPLVWHLDTSMERLVLSVNACVYAAVYFMLSGLESDPALRAPHEVIQGPSA